TRAIRTLHRSDPRRPGVLLRRYDTTLKGYGERVQYSVFMVDCPPSHLLVLRHDLTDAMDIDEDSVVICDLGMSTSADAQRITWLGGQRYQSGGRSIII
ncbi:CRISPR-associated endonuclease Cas2, partial [Propionibacterium freudenreichii]